ncbi:MAG: hypothetical protein LLG04_14225 [Parachlamydia sp.]|nr:hypothetical protein [Parachlamydia sp.]
MTIAKISFTQHIIHPWSFKTIDGKKIELSRIEKIKSIVMLILGLPLAIVGGPLLFYTYTNICKNRKIKKLERLEGDFSDIGIWYTEIAAKIAGKNLEKIADLLPQHAAKLRALHPLSKQIKSLLDQCKVTKDEPTLRSLLLQLGGSLKKLHDYNSEIENRLNIFIQKPECNTAAREKIDQAQEERESYQEMEREAYSDMATMVDTLPIHPGDMENEIKLLKGIPYGQQIGRFRKILQSQFVVHDVIGDGACGPRSLSNGIWPKLLQWRQKHGDQTSPEEEALAEQLRNEVVDYMIENVNNVKNNKKYNDDGTEALDYRSFCAPDAPGGGDDDPDVLFQRYADNMRRKSVWFGDQEMKAAARKYGAKEGVFVMTFSPDGVEVKNNRLYPREQYCFGNPKGRRIFLFHSGGHYEVMSPRVAYTERLTLKVPAGRQR